MTNNTTPTTIDLAPLLALRPECEAMADRLESDDPPAESEYDELDRRCEAGQAAFKAAILAHIGELERAQAIRVEDGLREIAAHLTGIVPASILADELYADARTDRLIMRNLERMVRSGSDIAELRDALQEAAEDLTAEGLAAATALVKAQS